MAARITVGIGRGGDMTTGGSSKTWWERFWPERIRTEGQSKGAVPGGLWQKCDNCSVILYRDDLEKNLGVCPKCAHHHRIGARQRLDWLLDAEPRQELAPTLQALDPLGFKDSKAYPDRLAQARQATGEQDALVVVQGQILQLPIIAAAFELEFIGGSMGSVVGEKFTQAAEIARQERIPLVCFAASGGARMQEGLFSLMQMAKTSAALARLQEARVPFISVMTDPTMGGVSASLAMLGDILLAEPKALIGFAGPRVIKETVRQTLPAGFQRSEFLLQHGAIDQIVDRRALRGKLAQLLALLTQQTLSAV